MRGVVGIFVFCFLGITTAFIVPQAPKFPIVFSPKGNCPEKGEFPVLLPDNEDPTIFYICAHGSPVKKRCSNNMVFDSALNVCVRKTNVLEHPKTFSPEGECPPTDGENPVYLPDSEDPSIFYECSNGLPIQQKCPDGLVFNTTQNVCVRKELFNDFIVPYIPKGQCPPVDGLFPVFLPDTEDNTIYYECNHGQPIKMKCPLNLIFDPNLSVCVRKNFFMLKF